VDTHSGKVVAGIPLGKDACGLAVGEGSVWAVAGNNGLLTQIAPSTNEILSQTALGKLGIDVTIGEGSVWVVAPFTGVVLRVDPHTQEVLGRYDLPGAIGDGRIDANGAGVWVTLTGSVSVLARFDPVSDTFVSVEEVKAPVALSVSEDCVWVLSSEENCLTRIHASSGEVTGRVAVGEVPGGCGAVEVDGHSAWVATTVLIRVDPVLLEVVDRLPLGQKAVKIAKRDRSIWISVKKGRLICVNLEPTVGP